MRILHVIPSLIKGGAERLALDVVKGLQEVPDVDARLVYFNDINQYRVEYSDVDMELINASIQPSVIGNWSVNLDSWYKLLEEFKPDIVHSHLFQADLLSRYKIDDGIQYVSHCHDNMHQLRSFQTDHSLSKKRLTDLYERHFIIDRYRASKNTFISISPDTTKYFKKNLPNDLSCHIIELANAINTEKFAQNTAQFPTDGQPFRILNVGSFVPKKNQSLLIDIAVKLKELEVDFEIRFAGDGAELENVKAKSQKFGLNDNIVFLGNVENVEQEMWNSHVYVHTAHYEPFGLVLLEAMAAGLPIISLDGKGNRDLIKDGENGYFIREANPSTFVSKILELRDNPNLWSVFSLAGLKCVKKFDINTYVQYLLRIYEKRS